MSRNKGLSIRIPEPTSVGRGRGFNRPQVERFFENLWQVFDKHKIQPSNIYNMDETGSRTSCTKPPKIISVKGKKQVGVISNAEKGQLVTLTGCDNATGSFLPPSLIFPRKTLNQRLLEGAPPGTRAWCTPSGWINSSVFLEWLKFFSAGEAHRRESCSSYT